MSDRFIPFCIMEDILLKLPGRSVARFKCVCKSWQNFLTSPCFAAINFKNSMENSNPNLKVVFSTLDGKFSYFDHENNKLLPLLPPSKIRYSYTGRHIKILGSCNGFVCISPDLTNDVYVWNPYTSQYRIMHVAEGEIVGFGYNETCNDYQVLTGRAAEDSTTQVCVFSLRSNSCKRLGKIPYVLDRRGAERGILVNGALHWMAHTDSVWNRALLAYDIKSQNFNEVPIPKRWITDKIFMNTVMRIGMLQDHLCVSISDRRSNRLEIWLMANCGKEESWTMYYNINHNPPRSYIPNDFTPICLMSKGKEIMLSGKSGSWNFPLYDRDKHCLRNFMHGTYFDAITCMETNISLETMNKEYL